jgi:hypothetical protein
MKVRLTRKLADRIDGVDLRGHEPGDLLELPSSDAGLLVAERWAIPDRRERSDTSSPKRRVDDYPEGAIS